MNKPHITSNFQVITLPLFNARKQGKEKAITPQPDVNITMLVFRKRYS